MLLTYIWKNVGCLDDKFIIRFLLGLNAVLSGHITAGQFMVGKLENAFFITCLGANPANFVQPGTPLKVGKSLSNLALPDSDPVEIICQSEFIFLSIMQYRTASKVKIEHIYLN